MSKNIKRALLAGVAGALQAADNFYKTERAQAAERLREERLAAIRAEERQQDREFQRETFQMQADRESARDERMTNRQIDAERRAEERAVAAESRREESQRRLMREGAEIQARHRPPENTGYIEFIDSEGIPGTMTRAQFSALSPEQRRGMKFRGEYAQAETPAAPPQAPQGQRSAAGNVVNVTRGPQNNLIEDWGNAGGTWTPPMRNPPARTGQSSQ